MKKLFAVLLTGVLAFGFLTGCGSKGGSDDKVIKVGATAVPHAEILNAIKDDLQKEGYTLEVTEFTDYVQPNKVVDDGTLDANFFQHKPYMDSFNEEQGTKLVSVGTVHYEPLGIYAGKSKDLKNIPEGATIAVPNDTTNEARALLLLEKNGVITLKKDAGLNATAKDIEQNPKNVKIQELEAAQIPKSLQDVDFAVINGNYAMEAGLSVKKDALAIETADSEAAKTYANILCVKEGNENTDKTKALLKALQSETVKNFIDEKYDGSVVAIFE